jgi:hypothetical protein
MVSNSDPSQVFALFGSGYQTVLLLRFGTLDLYTGIAANGFAPS